MRERKLPSRSPGLTDEVLCPIRFVLSLLRARSY